MLFILDGDDLSLYSDGDILAAASGDSIFVPRETLHGLRNNSDRKAQVVVVNNPAGLDRFLVEAGTPGMMSSTPPVFDEAQQEKVMNVAPRYATEFKWDVEF